MIWWKLEKDIDINKKSFFQTDPRKMTRESVVRLIDDHHEEEALI